MPIYSYQCNKCKLEFDKENTIANCSKGSKCPKCKSRAKRIVSSGIHLTGRNDNWGIDT